MPTLPRKKPHTTGFPLTPSYTEGQPAPELRDVASWRNGGPVKLSDLRGKVVILVFASGWSGPRGVRGVTPELFSIHDKYHDQGLVIIEVRVDGGLGLDSPENLDEKLADVKKPFWEDRDVPVPIALVLTDPKAKGGCPVMEDYGITALPTSVLIDRQGRVVGRFNPRLKSDQPTLEKVVNAK